MPPHGTPLEMSWFWQHEGVQVVNGDMCMQGMFSQDGTNLCKKPTKWMSNSRHILNELDVKCDGGHDHEVLLHGRAKSAAIYPVKLCKSILRGLRGQLIHDGVLGLNSVGTNVEEENHIE